MKWFVTFGGVGLSKWAPGTLGTIAALPLVYLISQLGPLLYMGFVVFLTLVAIFVCERYQQVLGGDDRQEIVIDEVIGILVTMTWVPMTWQAFVLGFLIFRVLDIWKPLAIGMVDRKIKGGVGVIADDLLAGIIGNIILQVLLNQTTWLGQGH